MSPVPKFDWRHAAILRMLLYPIQFDTYPLVGIDRVLARDVHACYPKLLLNEVAAAIDAGLTSNAKRSQLIPMHHSEEVIRSYLAILRTRLNVNPPLRLYDSERLG